MAGQTSLGEQPSRPVPLDPVTVHAMIEARLAAELQDGSPLSENLHAAMRHALLAPGKRVRSVLLALIAEPNSADLAPVLDVGCAVEMVHTASLILDDLPCMDDATLRRKAPTTHAAFGQATAILAAIALLTRSFGIISRLEGVAAETRNRLTGVLAEAVGWNGLAAGQDLDVGSRASLIQAEQIERLNWLKTGVLFAAAAEIGAIMRGLDARETAAVRSFARHFGLAFQTADDLLDSTAAVEEAGKDVGRDGNITTLVSLLGPGRARTTCREHLDHAEAALDETRVSAAPLRALIRRVFAARLQSS